MLVLLVLAAILRTLQGSPLPSPHASSYVVPIDFVVREAPAAPDCGGPHCRTVDTILRSCLLTIFACVWKSAHPNINGPRDSGWACFKRKLVTMLCVVIAPELVLYWALCQRSAAKELAKMYNEEFVTTGADETKISLWMKITDWVLSSWKEVVGWFQPLPKEATRRGDGQLWTTTHGFFIQMGGFILYKNEYPKEVLDYDRLAQLLREECIDSPTATERDLQDRSKGDTTSKAIVVLQMMWFVLQCIARAGQRLPLSELEVVTLAFAVMNMAIYVAWLDKPQGVKVAICIPLKIAAQQTNISATPSTGDEPQEPTNLPQVKYQQSTDNLPLIRPCEEQRDDSTDEQLSWLRRMSRKDRKEHNCFLFSLFLLYRIVGSVFHFASKLSVLNQNEKKLLRMPMFYSSFMANQNTAMNVSFGIGTVFGAIHLLAVASEFPSHLDLVLWRVSAILLTVAPLLLLLVWILDTRGIDMIVVLVVLYLILMPLYVASRIGVIILALLAIRHPSDGVLVDVSWTSYIPHF